uniref:Uncharacterized protein n=1 Tax=Phlebotomus papatasi TaxID=29031 RepID=A0A1B0EYU1_PHLPP
NDNYETVLCDNCDNDGFRNDVKQWSIDENIPQSSLKRLLDIFHKRIPNVFPRDPRTLLQTPISQIEIRTIGEGVNTEQYWHYGLEKSLKLQLKNLKKSTTISLNVNMDGLPLHESSRHEFWPILASIHEMSGAPPMIIGIYYGVGKPNDVKWFLTPFISELQNILDKGIIIDGVDGDSVHIRVQLRAFICDSPARAYVKGVTYCNGQHGCHKCTTVGEWSYETNCNIFPHTFSEKRNDADFRSKNYSSHIKMESPLQVLPINMVEDFVTSDELHLLHLGEMKKLLLKWRDGKFKNKVVKWTAQQISNISQEMEKFKLPSECHRSVRGLDYLSVWKGVEFRNFLHYVGIVILKDIVPESVYEHFLRLFGAVTICSSENYKNLLDIAHQMLCDYVELYKKIYGKDYIISNVHNLVHIVDDVKRFGILQTISSYPFENELYKIKNLLRTGHKPLQQVAKRIIEKSQTQIFKDKQMN